jgi:hypothetical protein
MKADVTLSDETLIASIRRRFMLTIRSLAVTIALLGGAWAAPSGVHAECDYGYYACDASSCCPTGYSCGTGANGCGSDECCKPGNDDDDNDNDNDNTSYGCSYSEKSCGDGCIPSGATCCGGLSYCSGGQVCNASNTGCTSPGSSSTPDPDLSYSGDDDGACAAITIPSGNGGSCAITSCNRFFDDDTCSTWYVVNGKRFDCGSCTSQSDIQSCAERAGSYCAGGSASSGSSSSSSTDDEEDTGSACRVSGSGSTQQASWMLCMFAALMWRARRRHPRVVDRALLGV